MAAEPKIPARIVRSAGIDCLRGVFAMWVFCAHLAMLAPAIQGDAHFPAALRSLAFLVAGVFQPKGELHPAVVGFLVLSGYCIHLSRARTASIFAIRRAFRIVPIFVFASLLGAAAFFYVAHVAPALLGEATGSKEFVLSGFLAKLSTIAALTPAFHPASYSGNAPLLTVMVEIQLYFVYGILLALGLLNERFGKWIIVACGVAFGASLVVATLRTQYPVLYNWWQNSSLYGFLPYWWLGVACTYPRVQAWLQSRFLPIAVAWFVLSPLILLDPTAMLSEVRKLLFAAMIGLLIAKMSGLTMIGRNNPVAAIGRAGYSLYAVHLPVSCLLVVSGVPWWLVLVFVPLLSYGLFLVFEKPLDDFGHALSDKAKVPLASM